jgi:folate-binding protein YgfZ
MTQEYPLTDYQAACERAALFDMSARGRLVVSGPEAAFFLHNLCTNDIKNLAAGAGCEICLCNLKARVLGHGWVYRLPGDPPTYWLDVADGLGPAMFQHLNRHWISEQIELSDRTDATAQLQLVGPAAAGLLQDVLGDSVNGMSPVSHQQRPAAGGGTVEVFRNDALGLPGFDLVCAREQGPALAQALVERGATPAGVAAWELLRVEAGLPRFGFELDENRAVFEVGRTRQAISYTKGCYLGQEPIVMARDRGHVNRTLLGLVFDGGAAPPRGAKVLHNGQEVGQVTSGVVSPRLGRPVALTYLKRGSQEPGTAVEAEADGERRPAHVAALPLVT